MTAVAVLGLAAILCYSLAVPTDLMRDQVSYLVLTMACGAVIWAAWRSNLPTWLMPIATFLGDISYSLYLTHWIANDVARVLKLPVSEQWALFTLAALVGSYLCYRFFEMPMRVWLGSSPYNPERASKTSTMP